MDIYLYVDGNSFWHRLDPRPKFALLLAVLLLAVAGDHPALPGALLAGGLLAVHTAGAWRSLKRVRGLIAIVSAFSLVVWTLLARGATPLIGPIAVESVLYGLATACKLSAMMVASVAWLATTRNEEIVTGFIRLGLPYRFAFAFSLALRLVPTFVGTGMTIVQAQRARGLDVESGNLLQRMRKHLPLLIPVFVAALRSSNLMAMALEARGFGAQPRRTYYLELRMGAADWAVLALALAGIALSFWIRLRGLAAIPGLYR